MTFASMNRLRKEPVSRNRRLRETGSFWCTIPSVEDLIARISVAAGWISDMPGIFQNIRNSMQPLSGLPDDFLVVISNT
ncbi:hypothetical protein TNCV_2771571 [Trichonephila clavipes]|nr:hypothetical protein TNCV_2771571 [Trichonephila clavipes]